MSFADALATRNLDEIRAWPKADLHNHGFLSADRAYIYAKTGRDIAPVKAPLTSMNEMHRWVGSALEGLFAGPSGRLLGIEGAFALAMRDGVSRIELGDDVWMITQDCGTAAELYSSIADIARRMAPGIEWIPLVSMSRHVPVAALERWLHHFLEAGRYKSLDLSGDELSQPIEHFAPLYALAKANGLSLKAHVGEWGTADDVWRAVELLQLDEVQHGIAAASSPQVMRFLADHRIRLNICPTSNLLLGRVESLECHPIRTLFDAGVIVTINTDDALVFGKSVSEEFLTLFAAGLFAAEELEVIRLNGLADKLCDSS